MCFKRNHLLITNDMSATSNKTLYVNQNLTVKTTFQALIINTQAINFWMHKKEILFLGAVLANNLCD